MPLSCLRPLACAAAFGSACAVVAAKVEPGLEQAVEWKWMVAPPASDEWGMPLPEKADEPVMGMDVVPPEQRRPATYEVRKGDVIVKIAKRLVVS